MIKKEPEKILDKLCNQPGETEIVEFKKATSTFDSRKLGKYFSALSNEANLKDKTHSWLVFGIENITHRRVGSNYRNNRTSLDNLKVEIANETTNRVTFIEIYELNTHGVRIVMFQIPAAPNGLPIAYKGHYYGRDGEALVPLNIEEIERIRHQVNTKDWSAKIIAEANIDDLDEKAVEIARNNYKNKFSDKALEIDSWDIVTFLNKAKITIKGKITRTAIILLGKEESEHFINPAEAKLRWLLKDSQSNDKDYLIVSCPLLLAVNKIYAKIRNSKYRYLREATLFPEEIEQYEPFTIREAINNTIGIQ